MEAKEVMLSSLEQSQGYLTRSLEGLTQEEFAWSPDPACNSIAFILWHTTRVEDFFVNRVVQRQTELYEAEGWREKLATPEREMGYQYTVEQLQAWPVPDLAALQGYAGSVRKKTLAFLDTASAEKLSEVQRPDRSPESIGAALTRICTEVALHMGQIAYLRGMQRGLDK